MKRGQFAKKYDVVYVVVKEASEETESYKATPWLLDFSEAELLQAVRIFMDRRIKYHEMKLAKAQYERTRFLEACKKQGVIV